MKQPDVLRQLANRDTELAASVREALRSRMTDAVVRERIEETLARAREALVAGQAHKIAEVIRELREVLSGITSTTRVESNNEEVRRNDESQSLTEHRQPLPKPPDLTKAMARAFLEACGGQLDAGDCIVRRVKVGRKEFLDTASALVQRVGIYRFGNNHAKAKSICYIELIAKGFSDEEAVIKVSEKIIARLPEPPSLTPEIARAFFEACDGVLSAKDKVPRTIEFGGEKFRGTPMAVIRSVRRRIFQDRGSFQRPIRYIELIAEGNSDERAFKQVKKEFPGEDEQKKMQTRVGQRLPNPPKLTQEMARAFLEACGGDLNSRDSFPKMITLEGKTLQDTPAALVQRVGKHVFNNQNATTLSIRYILFIAEGKPHVEAKRLVELGEEGQEDQEFEKLDKLNPEEAIAFFGRKDPAKYRFWLQHAYPHLSDKEIDQFVVLSFKGLITTSMLTKEQEYLRWEGQRLPEVTLDAALPERTAEPTITIAGHAPNAECVCLAGTLCRRVHVDASGCFTVTIPLAIGEENEIRIMGIDREQKVRSEQQRFTVLQEGEADDIEELFLMLSELCEDLQHEVQQDPGRFQLFVHCAEQFLIRAFARSFKDGETYVRHLIGEMESSLIRGVLRGVLKDFQDINRMKFLNVKQGKLKFFQKYCAALVRRRMENGSRGVVLANDPGLGKTRTVLVAVADGEAAIFTPNSVVSTWDEEAGDVLEEPDLLVLRGIPHAKRKELIRNASNLRLVTNIEFLRKKEDIERFELLSTDRTVVVHDEAHSRTRESDQSQGARKLRNRFQINVTATPAKDPKTVCRMLATVAPEDPRFRSDVAFAKAFPPSDPAALKILKLLLDKHMIRFRKEDVMEEIDPGKPLQEQLHRLLRKEVIPPEELGEFTMSEGQAQAIYEMFLDWSAWTRKYDRYVPNDDVAEEDHLRQGGVLVKRHALRQTVNNSSYIGSRAPDAKSERMRKIWERCNREDRKLVIFCLYNAQTLKYAEMFQDEHPAVYTGLVSKEKEKKNAQGAPMKFRREEGEHGFKRRWTFDARGYPEEAADGETMSALDYERLTFQNAPDRRLIICTYQAGAVGQTFTAGKAMAFDDLPEDIIADIQAKDRIHRIDEEHQTHSTVQYYSLQSRYPESFLERMKKRWVVKQEDGTYKEYRSCAAAERDPMVEEGEEEVQTAYAAFFAQGTWDQYHSCKLDVQRKRFRLINDGIADESILYEGYTPFAVDLG